MFAVNDGHNHRLACAGSNGCPTQWPINHVNRSIVRILESTWATDENDFEIWAVTVAGLTDAMLPERDDAA